MFVTGGWLIASDTLTKRQRRMVESYWTKAKAKEGVEALATVLFIVTGLPGGAIFWPVIFIATLHTLGAPWWWLLFALPVVLYGLIAIGCMAYIALSDRWHRKCDQLRSKYLARIRDASSPLYYLQDRNSYEYDKELMERHPDVVDEFLRDPDVKRMCELRRSDECSWTVRSNLHKEIMKRADKALADMHELDKPWQEVVAAEAADQAALESRQAAEQKLAEEALRAAADEEARFLMGERE